VHAFARRVPVRLGTAAAFLAPLTLPWVGYTGHNGRTPYSG
jgi:hypothetical protein